jgi:hypothetical protein
VSVAAPQPTYVVRGSGVRHMSALIAVMALSETVVVAALLLAGVPAGISLLFFVAFLPAGLIWLLLPRRFEVWPDRLVIVFPLRVRWSLPFETIAEVKPAKWWHAYAFMGVRFASNPALSVDIMRVAPSVWKRPNIVVSPDQRAEFIEPVNAALTRNHA